MTKPWVHNRLMHQQKKVVEFITVQEVAKQLQCSKSNVYKLCDSGELQSIKLGDKKGLRILKQSFDAFLCAKLAEWGGDPDAAAAAAASGGGGA